jgi:hypothetical protein
MNKYINDENSWSNTRHDYLHTRGCSWDTPWRINFCESICASVRTIKFHLFISLSYLSLVAYRRQLYRHNYLKRLHDMCALVFRHNHGWNFAGISEKDASYIVWLRLYVPEWFRLTQFFLKSTNCRRFSRAVLFFILYESVSIGALLQVS